MRPINADNLCCVGCNRSQEASVAAPDFYDSTRRDACDGLHLIEEPIVPAVVCVLMLLIVERGRQRLIGAMRVSGHQFQIEARYSRMREQQGPSGDQEFLVAFTAAKSTPDAAQWAAKRLRNAAPGPDTYAPLHAVHSHIEDARLDGGT